MKPGSDYDRHAPRKAVNLSLNQDLLARARGLTRNLSATVEALLADFVSRQPQREPAPDQRIEDVIQALNEFHEQNGFLSDEVPSLWIVMPQFAVYKNPRRGIDTPFVVQQQSNRLEKAIGRVVMPLIRRGDRAPRDHPLTPHFVIQTQAVYADPLNLATVRADRLKIVRELLSDRDQDRVIRAIDEMISRS
jgi:toxin CcdB